MLRPCLLAVLALSVVSCAEERTGMSTSYSFRAAIDPGAAIVTVDGTNVLTYAATFPTFAEAQEQLHLPVRITEAGSSNDTELTPGYCDETASRLDLELGDMLVEHVTLVVTSGLFLNASDAYCQGTKGGFRQQP